MPATRVQEKAINGKKAKNVAITTKGKRKTNSNPTNLPKDAREICNRVNKKKKMGEANATKIEVIKQKVWGGGGSGLKRRWGDSKRTKHTSSYRNRRIGDPCGEEAKKRAFAIKRQALQTWVRGGHLEARKDANREREGSQGGNYHQKDGVEVTGLDHGEVASLLRRGRKIGKTREKTKKNPSKMGKTPRSRGNTREKTNRSFKGKGPVG